jgi:hypothetical protein
MPLASTKFSDFLEQSIASRTHQGFPATGLGCFILGPLRPGRNRKAARLLEELVSKLEGGRAARLPLRIPLRYRTHGQQDWLTGETVNLSETGVLFTSNHMLEVNTQVEITFQSNGVPMLRSSSRRASIVRRVLSNWPETYPVFGARFSN